MRVLLLVTVLLLLCPSVAARADVVPLPTGWRTPVALAFGPDDALWVALEGSWALGRLPSDGSTPQVFALPPPSQPGTLWGLTVTEEGVAWAASGEALYRVLPGAGAADAFPYPVRAEIPGDVLVDREGDVWVALTDAGTFLSFDAETSNFTAVATPQGTGPLGLAAIEPGLAAFTATYANTLGILDTTADRVTMRTVNVSSPVGIFVAEDAMWVGEMGGSSFARVSGEGVVHYPTTASPFYPISGPTGILVAKDGAVWFAEHFADRISRFDPESETLVEYTLAGQPGVNVQRVAEAPDGRVWATLTSRDALAVVTHEPALTPPEVPRDVSSAPGSAARVTLPADVEVAAMPGVAVARAGDAVELTPSVAGATKVLVARTAEGARVGQYVTLHAQSSGEGEKESPGVPLAAMLVVLALVALGRRWR